MGDHPTETKNYCGNLFVHQSDAATDWMIWLVVGLSTLFGMTPIALYTFFFGADSAEGPGLGVFVLSMLMFLVGVVLPFYIQERLNPGKYFFGTTQVNIDDNGIDISGLGVATWKNVLSLEGIPDSDSSIIVHTVNLGTLLLTDTPAGMLHQVLPTLIAHLDAEKQNAATDEADAVFRVIPFHWRRFQLQIVAGYVIGGGTGIAGAIYGSTLLKSLVALFIIPPMLAYLVWMFPLWGLTFGSARRVTVVSIKAGRLVSMDGKINVDLAKVTFNARKVSGIAYQFEIVTLTHQSARKFFFIPHDSSWETFVSSLQATCAGSRI